MRHPIRLLAVCLSLVLLGGIGYGLILSPAVQSKLFGGPVPGPVEEPQKQKQGGDTITVEVTDYRPEPSALDELLSDDRIEDKDPAFDETLAHRTPIDGWLVNLSGAVIRLDVPMARPDQDPDLLMIHASYKAAVDAAKKGAHSYLPVLPSVNLVDGMAKQFDDGLYAALDQAYYAGLESTLESHVRLVRRIFDKVGPDSPAAPFLAAGLEVAGERVAATDAAAQRKFLQAFEGNELRSKPIGFYTWNPTLESCFRFLRYFQQTFIVGGLPIPEAIAGALASDEALMADYRKANEFYGRLTNPLKYRSMADLASREGSPVAPTDKVAMFPSSASREGELIERLFPMGIPADADLMRELIVRIRSGEVDLKPRPDSGWYDHQVYALETLLLPEKGRESEKLLLTKSYKKRMLEAFKALMTKRRETHARQLEMPAPMSAAVPRQRLKLPPRLRVEPSLTYYLRTARSYAFLADFLDGAVGGEALKSLHGLTKDGRREKDLETELRDMRDFFYGLYLLGCEDIGLKPEFLDGEEVDRARCEELAAAWLKDPLASADLAADTRVAVPIAYDRARNATRLWVTLGVRMAKLDATWAKPPMIRPAEEGGEWSPAEGEMLQGAYVLVPVDEFAEVEIRGSRVLNREELRAICDKHKTKEAILKALRAL